MKKVLILGGNGLIGHSLAETLQQNGNRVTIVDKRPRTNPVPKVTYLTTDILKKNAIERVIKAQKPDIIINCVNIATLCSHNPKRGLPRIIAFYLSVYRALEQLDHVHYIQVGTTGSGGLGLNIPFTHGEKIESLPIIYKAAFAGITTAMLTLLSRSYTPDFRVSEIKPGLAVFADSLTLDTWEESNLIVLDGGESGYYTSHELALLTSYMGFTTVSEVARKVKSVLDQEQTERSVSRYDVIATLNSTIIAQSAEDEAHRKALLTQMRLASSGDTIIATGNLGPPSITRDLILSFIHLNYPDATSQARFEAAIEGDKTVQNTFGYIRNSNKRLAKWLKRECDFRHYTNLSPYVGEAKEAWQVVRARIEAHRPTG